MTKKHFNAIADAIAAARLRAHDECPGVRGRVISDCTADDLAHNLADLCAEENPLFDRAQFLAACGVDES